MQRLPKTQMKTPAQPKHRRTQVEKKKIRRPMTLVMEALRA